MTSETSLTVFVASEDINTDGTTNLASARVDNLVTAASAIDTAGGANFANDGTVMLLVTAGAADTITMTSEVSCNFHVTHSVAYGPLASPCVYILGPFAPNHYRDGYGLSHLTVNVGASASTTLLAFKAGPVRG
jgi:hypothetical protein